MRGNVRGTCRADGDDVDRLGGRCITTEVGSLLRGCAGEIGKLAFARRDEFEALLDFGDGGLGEWRTGGVGWRGSPHDASQGLTHDEQNLAFFGVFRIECVGCRHQVSLYMSVEYQRQTKEASAIGHLRVARCSVMAGVSLLLDGLGDEVRKSTG